MDACTTRSLISLTFVNLLLSQSVVAIDGTLIENLGTFKGTSFHWTVNLDAGTAVSAQVTDSKGETITGKPFTIQPGTTGCTVKQNQFVAPPSTSDSSDSGTISSTGVGASATSSPSQDTQSTVSVLSNTFSTALISSQNSKASTSAPNRLHQYQPTHLIFCHFCYHVRQTPCRHDFAILIPCLLVLIISGLLLVHWRRQAQTPSARWFDKPAYRTRSIFDHRSEEVAPQEAEPAVHRPVLNIVPPTSTARPSPENAPTQGMLLNADRSSKYMETLHSRIDALVAENALLANLATTQVDMPPPAYA
ncbi:hypothetical protein B0H13DRAFT_2021051 [Mycena leptocephala]|nr:hypothetical protein B0H13DRAFT_2021051 [Mycena leptocephala]